MSAFLKLKKPKDYQRKKEQGFTLVEMAIVIMITGMLMVAGAQLYDIQQQQEKHDTTVENIEDSYAAVRMFYSIAGRYPCPANPNLGPDDSEYGLELCRTPEVDCAANVPLGLSCVTTLAGDHGGPSINTLSDGQPDPVMIGAIPIVDIVETLNDANVNSPVNIERIHDAYGMKFIYAVSEYATNEQYSISNPMQYDYGAIRIEDEHGQPVIDPEASAQFVVISTGDNGRGGFSKEGVARGDCIVPSGFGQTDPGRVPPPGRNSGYIDVEIENCDNNDALFISSIRQMADGSNYYDDTFVYSNQSNMNLWLRASAAEMTLYNTNTGNIGVGTDTPQNKLHIAGAMEVEAGIYSSQFCNERAGGCFNPVAIAGDPFDGEGGMKCEEVGEDTRTFSVVAGGISEEDLVCEGRRFLQYTQFLHFECPDGTYMNKIPNTPPPWNPEQVCNITPGPSDDRPVRVDDGDLGGISRDGR